MANPDTAGKDTTEYQIAKWVVIIGGIVMPIIASVTGYIASQPNPSEAGLIALGMIGAALSGVIGWASKIYTEGRSALKIAKVHAANPPGSIPFPSGLPSWDSTPPPVVSGEGKSTSG